MPSPPQTPRIDLAALEAELGALKVSALKRRARDAGVGEAELRGADWGEGEERRWRLLNDEELLKIVWEDELVMDELMAVRQQLKPLAAAAGLEKFTLMPLIVKARAPTLNV